MIRISVFIKICLSREKKLSLEISELVKQLLEKRLKWLMWTINHLQCVLIIYVKVTIRFVKQTLGIYSHQQFIKCEKLVHNQLLNFSVHAKFDQ